MILNCYGLAKFYGQNPQVFLDKTFSQIDRDLEWTDRLTESDRIESAWQEKLRE